MTTKGPQNKTILKAVSGFSKAALATIGSLIKKTERKASKTKYTILYPTIDP